MSTRIENEVVSMQFDNRQFESNVQTSLSTIDKLKQSLNFTGASKGLDNLNASAKNVNFSGLSSAIDTVKVKFSALEVMAVTALANITNSAVNAGKRLVSAFTIDPVKTGLAEYETQIGAVQTILANTQSKGSTLDDVNAALDELNTYADKTIYNFTEMTRNIGTFTAAGVDLDKSVTSIKGIANLAAVSGSTSQQASTAMYQLSQALASGTVKLQDWNSVVNAGMGGEVFQTALKRTATQMGYNVDAMIEKYGSFRESLTQGEWLTAEVLTETLTQLSGAYTEADLLAQGYTEQQAKEILELAATAESAATDVKTFTQLMDTLKESAQSGWTQTWEILIGDFEEAKALWSKVSEYFGEAIGKSAESRNKLLSGALDSNWDKLTAKIEEAGVKTGEFEEAVKKVAKAHDLDIDGIIKEYGSLEEAFQEGAISTDILKEALGGLTKAGKDLEQNFNLDNIGRTLKVGLSGDDVREAEKALKALGYDLLGADGKDYGDDGFYGTVTEEAVKAFQAANNLKASGELNAETLEAMKKAAAEANKEMAELDDSVYDLVDGVTELGGRELLIESLKNIFSGLMSVITPIKEAFREIFPPLTVEQLYNFLKGFRDLTANFKLSESASAKLKSAFKGLFSVVDIVWTLIKELAKGTFELLGNFSGLVTGVLGAAGSLGDWLTGLRKSVKEGNVFGRVVSAIVGFLQNGINKIKEFGSYLKGKFKTPGFDSILSLVNSIVNAVKKLGSGIGTVLSNAFRSGDIQSGLDMLNTGLFGALLLGIKGFLSDLGGVFDGAGGMLDGVKGILDGIKGCFEAWQQDLKANVLLKLAGAIGILAIALLLIASIDPDRLTGALAAITVLFADLMGSMAIFGKLNMKGLSGVTKTISMMIGISIAVLILASALKKIASLGWEDLAKGLVGIVGLTAIIVAAAKAMASSDKSARKGATQMVIFAAAIKILASVCKDLSELSWEQLAKGLVGVGVLMAEIAIFMRTAKFSGKSITTATGIVILSAAIKILASACRVFSQMSWEEIGKGLAAIGGLLAELAIFTRLTGNAKHVISTGLALVLIGASMKIFASAIRDLSSMSWEQLAKGLAGMAGSLVAVTVAMRLMPRGMITKAAGLVIVSSALIILANALSKMGNMSWIGIAKGLTAMGGALAILAIGLHLMKGTLGGSAALFVAAGAIAILSVALSAMGNMSWSTIIKGLITMAAALAVLGVAAMILKPLAPTMLLISGAFALFGVAMLAVGAGLIAVGLGLTAVGVGIAALIAGLYSALTQIGAVIPAVLKAFASGIIEFCKVIAGGADSIAEAVKEIVLAIIDVLVECVPALVDGLLTLVMEVLDSLASNAPAIIDKLFQFIVGLIQGIADNLPELIQAVVNVIMALFSGVADALASVDPKTFLNGIIGIGVLGAIVLALSALAAFIPGAMVGALGLGLVVAELAIVLAAIGALAQIPGLKWLVNEGGELMAEIGNALGKFVGSIVGGIAEGFTNSLPQIGTNLSTFMTNAQTFLDGAKKIDSSMLEGVGTLVGIIVALTAANVLESITSWITGSSSILTFASQLVPFGEGIAGFATAVANVDVDAVKSAVDAASTIITAASEIPNSGGIVSWFTGDNDMGEFGNQLGSFGKGIKDFADNVAGIDTESVTAAASAASSLMTAASDIPNSGGIISWFTGENDMGEFSDHMGSFGTGLKSFADNVANIDTESVTAAANAASILMTAASEIPNSGGIVSWFTGDNEMGEFSNQLGAFGTGLKNFSDNVAGINAEDVTAAASAATSLITAASEIPNSGGIVSWFTGENDLTEFSNQLTSFGTGLKNFSDSVVGVNAETVTAAANAAKSLITIASEVPNTGGIVSWFTGDNDLTSFGTQLTNFGTGLKNFSDSATGVNAETVTAAANAAKSLITIASEVPNTGGIVSWFTGDNDLTSFGTQLTNFGAGLKNFSDSATGVNAETVTAAATAAKSLITIASEVPNTGGIVSWFTGDNDLTSFGTQLTNFGTGLKNFSDSVTGINSEDVATAANAANTLIGVASSIPNSGGIISWFTGEKDLSTFGDQVGSFGAGIKKFADSVVGIDVIAVSTAVNAAKQISGISTTLAESNGVNIKTLGSDIGYFGEYMKNFGTHVSKLDSASVNTAISAAKSVAGLALLTGESAVNNLGSFGSSMEKFGKSIGTLSSNVSSDKITSIVSNIDDLTEMMSGLSGVDFTGVNSLSEAMNKLAKTSVNSLVAAFSNAKGRAKSAASSLIEALATGIKAKRDSVLKNVKSIASDASSEPDNYYNEFYSAGRYLVGGFASGISAYTYMATAKAAAMAKAAKEAAEEALGIKSPSRVFYKIGSFTGEGFVNALDDYSSKTYKAGRNIADSARYGLSDAITKVQSLIENGIDSQPTIRPVLDLSDVAAGTDALNSMLGMGSSIGVMSNIGAISSMMGSRQNGANDDVISAIKDLGRKIGNTSGDTYNVNGVTYDDGSNVRDTVKALINAVKVERRT